MIFFQYIVFEIIIMVVKSAYQIQKGKKPAPELCDYELPWLNAAFLVFDFSSSFVRRVC